MTRALAILPRKINVLQFKRNCVQSPFRGLFAWHSNVWFGFILHCYCNFLHCYWLRNLGKKIEVIIMHCNFLHASPLFLWIWPEKKIGQSYIFEVLGFSSNHLLLLTLWRRLYAWKESAAKNSKRIKPLLFTSCKWSSTYLESEIAQLSYFTRSFWVLSSFIK